MQIEYNVAAQTVNAVDSSENSASEVPVTLTTGKGEAVSEGGENFKNGDFSSNPIKSTPPSSSSCWYVATVTVSNEVKAERLISNLGLPIEVWLPNFRKVYRDNSGYATSYRFNLYSFLFFRFLPSSKEDVKRTIHKNILPISCVTGILKKPGDSEYAPIPAYQVDRFRQMLKDGGQLIEILDGSITKGKRVRFKNKYQGLEGIVDSVSDNEQYVYIQIDYLGCAKVKVKKGMIELYESHDAIQRAESLNSEKKITVSRTITDADWLALHPYVEMMPVDRQYLAFANSLLSYLDNGTLGVPFDKRKPLALTLACYVEDKRSRLRLFASFVASLRQKREYLHPIEQLIPSLPIEQLDALMGDYSPTKINAIDLCYFLLSCHDFSKLKTEEKLALGSRLFNVLRNLGSDKLQRNSIYADDRRRLLLEGWSGFKKFLHWLVNGPHYLWQEEAKSTIATILSDSFTLSKGVSPQYFTLTFARKSKLGSDIVSDIEKLKVLPSALYDVLDDDYGDELGKLTRKDRKKKRFQLKRTGTSHTSKEYPIVYDDISTRKYIVGETYRCQLAHYGNGWYLLSTPSIYYKQT